MALIEGLREQVEELNEAYSRELEARFQAVRDSLPFRLLLDLATQYNLRLYQNPALLRAEVHHPEFVIPQRGRIWSELHFIGEFNCDAPLQVSGADRETEPVAAFMRKARINDVDHWSGYQPTWEEYLGLLAPKDQERVAREIGKFKLERIKIVNGQDCAALYWKETGGSFCSDIHSAWLGLKPRRELSLWQLIHPPRPKTEHEWQKAIQQAYEGKDI